MSFLFHLEPGDLVYDCETFPNAFTVYFEQGEGDRSWYFEISEFRNDLEMLLLFMEECRDQGVTWVGFNNLGFDYPIMHYLYNGGTFLGYDDLYSKAMEIINTPWNRRFDHVIWESDHIIPQLDLYKIHHFDNVAKATGLKILEFNMRATQVMDLPFPVGTELSQDQVLTLAEYNKNDVIETKRFYQYSRSAIEMRRKLSKKFNTPMYNCSDVKIGEKILINALEEKGVKCHTYVDGRRKKLQTEREVIHPRDIILPYIRFHHPEFNTVHNDILNKTISGYTTKGVFDDMVANIQGVEYKFGTGGLHGSVENKIVRSTDTHQIVDVDVKSYYTNLAIVNEFYPEHLGQEFCIAYLDVYRTRQTYAEGTPENESYKLALNGAYGNSNNQYSALMDPQYTMSITLNGQLLLAMLIEQLIKAPGLQMIQANTDGVTYLCPQEHLEWTRTVIDWWQKMTKLELKETLYKSMFIRDVNSYIAVKDDDSVKRIGAYAYRTAAEDPGTRELPWHKDWSFRVIQMAAEGYLINGIPIQIFIKGHEDIYDFFGRTKVKGGSRLEHGGEVVPSTVRYYISNSGERLEKVMPAAGSVGQYKRKNGLSDSFYYTVLDELMGGKNGEDINLNIPHDERIHTKNESTYEDRRIGINTGWNVTLVNEWDDLERQREFKAGAWHGLDINYDYYIKETEKLVNMQEMNNDTN